jgi:hypothetical protein
MTDAQDTLITIMNIEQVDRLIFILTCCTSKLGQLNRENRPMNLDSPRPAKSQTVLLSSRQAPSALDQHQPAFEQGLCDAYLQRINSLRFRFRTPGLPSPTQPGLTEAARPLQAQAQSPSPVPSPCRPQHCRTSAFPSTRLTCSASASLRLVGHPSEAPPPAGAAGRRSRRRRSRVVFFCVSGRARVTVALNTCLMCETIEQEI